MNRRTRQVSYFLSSQYFSDGIRTTVSILLPSLLLAQFGLLANGMAMSIGALSVSLSDAPGPVQHRRNSMTATVLIGSAVTFITGFARMNDLTLGLEIALFGFFFSMFSVYNNRATSVGTAALLIMVLMLDRPLDASGVVRESGLILAGGIWYMAISLLRSRLRPYRPAQQALGQCIHEIARLMAIKADFYATHTRLDDDYRKLVAQQVVVNEMQDAVREMLFKSRQYMAESDRTSRTLVLTFSSVMDLYEQIVAMYYDYSGIRERFGKSGVLDTIARLVRHLSDELDHIGLTVQSITPSRPPLDLTPSLTALKQQIDDIPDTDGSTLVLKKVLVSLRNLSQRVATIQANMTAPATSPQNERLEYGRFVSHQTINWQSFRDNLTFDSSVFRHSVRVAGALLLGFLLTKFLPYAQYSYWVLLTILVILKPAFSLTRQRNQERIVGTFIGGLIGIVILTFIPNKTAHFVFLVLFMIGTYSAQRVNYIVMVICVTPFVLILFSFLGIGYLSVAGERLLDTLLGGLIALGSGYLLFPNWESHHITTPMTDVLKANIRYMQLLLDGLSGRAIPVVDYKLARKEVYVTSANIAASFQRMVSEPKHKQRNEKAVYEFVVLNYILSANIATITSTFLSSPQPYPTILIRPVKRALGTLTDTVRQLGEASEKTNTDTLASPVAALSEATTLPPDDRQLSEHLGFIQQVSNDIGKVVAKVSWQDVRV
ncbi:FUSC family protein [Spirosoma utsteinense]|uniref:Membrane protein YccC n=1 Tax=Spirosoma utsteinense TaxID=2585773 RepID=A0ABR6WBG8_9BACT|nr:FUSC family membrane protein [Spirosoma utsteinense]MBC3785277.1 putative membrane protein YccC [Spirosoma utsteinense]MBC3793919.1 putative membrane protein YccC [Spirosoma utsteinense]